jgi:hypothetical protein
MPALRGLAYAVERAADLSHLARNRLNRTGANPALLRHRKHAFLGSQLSLDSLFERSSILFV